MKAKILKAEGGGVVAIDSLEPGDWFVDSDGCLCLRTDENRYLYIGDEGQDASGAKLFDADGELVTPIQVTISY